MRCAWKELLSILPSWVSAEVDKNYQDSLQEIRLRCGQPAEYICGNSVRYSSRDVRKEDLLFCINTASRYSPWAAGTMSQGFLTGPGGHRIGVCGEAVSQGSHMQGIRNPTSLCIRVARDFPGIADRMPILRGSALLIGPPGAGKTTLLRDLIRKIGERQLICVVDERGELFPGDSFHRGKRMDVLTGCSKPEGIECLLRTMGPEWIAVDEVTAEDDCNALIQAGWCGVKLLATAHAYSTRDLKKRSLYRSLLETRLFDHIFVLDRDKSWREERME